MNDFRYWDEVRDLEWAKIDRYDGWDRGDVDEWLNDGQDEDATSAPSTPAPPTPAEEWDPNSDNIALYSGRQLA